MAYDHKAASLYFLFNDIVIPNLTLLGFYRDSHVSSFIRDLLELKCTSMTRSHVVLVNPQTTEE